jgi:hypothetical protein
MRSGARVGLRLRTEFYIGLLPWGEGIPAAAWSDSDKRGCSGQRTCCSPLLAERSNAQQRGAIPLALAVPEHQDRCSFSLGEKAACDSALLSA